MLRIVVAMLALALIGCGASGQTQTSGDLTVRLETEPSTPIADRPTTLRVTLLRGGSPVEATRVTLARTMAGMQHPGDTGLLIAQPLGGGRYEAQTAFAMGSRWEVTVGVTIDNTQLATVTFPLEVEQP